MKPFAEFLSELRHLQVKLWIEEGRLRYSAPPGTITPDLLEQMRSRKSEILAFLEQVNPDLPEPIKLISRDRNLPLSFAQESLWFLDQLEGKNAAYNIAMAFRLKGNLNLSALEQAFTLLTERHEILRTNIANRNGFPLTILREKSKFIISLIDLENLSKSEQKAEEKQLIEKESLQPFDLENDSLVRVSLIRLQAQEHILLLTLHHIIFDGWSSNLLHRELEILYFACQQGNSSPLPSLPIQYIDFASWQRERFAGEDLQKQLSYWKQQLENAPPLLDLPTDYLRPKIQTFSGAKHSLQVSSSVSAALKTLSQQEGTTLFMTLLAAFNILLSRCTGTEDIVVGSPVAGRTRPELEPLIGFFINTVVLRTRWHNNPSFRELLAKVKDVTLGAYEHQEMPFEKLVQELQPERNLSYNPLFQVWLNMLNLGEQQLEMPGLTVETLSSSEAPAKFDITLYVRDQLERIELEWVYNRDLFNPETIIAMAERFQTLLENIVKNPAQAIANLSVLSDRERQRLRHAKNSVAPHHPFIEFPQAAIEQSISNRFEEQVRKYPNQVAIYTKNYRWSYRELNQRGNAIAQTILQLYPDGSQTIALLFEHDAQMVAAILGVLKAGKTYVPLDPTYPQQRLDYILKDSQTPILLTNNKNLAFAQELTTETIQIINIDRIALESFSDQVNLFVTSDTLAYILYTSGSTGQPKGVIQNHRNVLHFIRNYTNNLQISANDKLILLASYSFDAAVMDIFGALLNGATLYPIDIKTEGFTHLANTLKQAEITIYHSTPTLYRHFLDTLPQPSKESETLFPQIRLVVMGGEEVIKKDLELYQTYFSQNCIFVNGLGPTESTVTLQYFINRETKQLSNLVPVGYPVEATEILLLNQEGINAEIYGEIAIRSPYIALGYWQKPQLTQTVFLPDPEGGNRRIYRTGDLGRLKVDGTVEFLGRKDFQVKIRGFRIELGEIEATLRQHPFVQETVVIAREDIPGNKRLVAYIIPTSSSNPPEQSSIVRQLHQYLKQKLPDYMVPSDFVLLDVLPLTPNGKINRLALPALTLPTPNFAKVKSEQYPTLSDTLELQLAKIWENILGIQPIGLNDNFFELGGHSLLAIRLFSEIEKIFGRNITLTTLFQYPTVGELANVLRQEGWLTSWSSLVPIQPHGSKSPFFYVHNLYGDLIHSRNLLLKLGADQPVYGLQAKGLDGKETPHTCFEDMASHYIKEIQTVQPHGPYLLGGWCAGGMIAFEMAQQLHAQGEMVKLLAIFDGYPSRIVSQLEASSLDKIRLRISEYILRLSDKIQRNQKQFNRLNLPEKLIFVNQQINLRIKDRINQVVYKFYVKPKDQLPHELRNLAIRDTIRDAIRQANKSYYPTAYSGKVVFFRAVARPKEYADYIKAWEELATGGLEIHEIPGYHGSIMFEPHVGVLAEKLRACIERVSVSPTLPTPNFAKVKSEQYTIPSDTLELKIAKIWENILGIKPIGLNDNFFEIGGHSLLAIRLFYEIEKIFGKNITLTTLFQYPTVGELAKLLRQEGWLTSWSSLVPIQPNGSKLPLFCIHVLGRGLTFYRPLANHLPPEQPLYGLAAQMMDKKYAPTNRVEDLAAHYIKEMQSFQPEGPYFLAGVSFGGLVAFEVAQQLVAQGQQVALLALLDTYAPGAVKQLPISERISAHWSHFLRLGRTYVLEKTIENLKGKIQRFNNQLNYSFKGICGQFYLSIGQPLPNNLQDFTFQQENQEAARNYVPQAYPGRVTLFRSMDEIAGVSSYRDSLLGWKELAAGGLEIHEVPSTHLGMLQEPHVQVLAEKLRTSIDKAH